MESSSKTLKLYSKIAGSMYLICMVASIAGGALIDMILANDTLLTSISNASCTLILAAILEIINSLGVFAIVVCFSTILKHDRPAMTAAYFGIRSIESAICLILSFLPILLICIINDNTFSDSQALNWINGLSLLRTVFWSYIYPVIFVSGGLMFYSMLFITRKLPRYISVWGLLALIGVFAAIFMPEIKMIPGIFIIANEIYLGIYLLLKGVR